MKTKNMYIGWFAALMLPLMAWSQTYSDKITKELTFENTGGSNTLLIAGINGSIVVEGYAGDKVMVEVTRTINAKTDARLETGKRELTLGVMDRADTLMIFLDGICHSFGRQRNRKQTGTWGYNWDGCNQENDWRRDEGYDYTMDFRVKVPAQTNLILSTVNEGDIDVKQVSGVVIANNVNGSIRLKNLTSAAKAVTVNGDVDLDFEKNPSQDCRFYTLNGDIHAWFRKGLAANMNFESYNGELYTNINNLSSLPTTVEKKPTRDGIRYQVRDNYFKIGSGGALLDFETFNGDVILKEKEN
jgi:hypothetical protein